MGWYMAPGTYVLLDYIVCTQWGTIHLSMQKLDATEKKNVEGEVVVGGWMRGEVRR